MANVDNTIHAWEIYIGFIQAFKQVESHANTMEYPIPWASKPPMVNT